MWTKMWSKMSKMWSFWVGFMVKFHLFAWKTKENRENRTKINEIMWNPADSEIFFLSGPHFFINESRLLVCDRFMSIHITMTSHDYSWNESCSGFISFHSHEMNRSFVIGSRDNYSWHELSPWTFIGYELKPNFHDMRFMGFSLLSWHMKVHHESSWKFIPYFKRLYF